MPTVKVGDVNIHYEALGKGEPLVLLHGLIADSATCFFRQIPVLAEYCRTIAMDHRGGGLSDKPDIPCSMEVMARDTAGLLDALGIRKAHIYGISMGGMIAQHLALCYPGMAASLVLASTSCGGRHSVQPDQAVIAALLGTQGTPEERTRTLVRFNFSQEFARSNPDVIERYIGLNIKHYPPPHAFNRRAEAIIMHDTYDRLPEISVPTLVIAGNGDEICPVENARILASRIRGAELLSLAGVGHFVSAEAPETVNKAIRDFLKRHPIAA